MPYANKKKNKALWTQLPKYKLKFPPDIEQRKYRRIPKVSKSMQAKLKAYKSLRKSFLKKYPTCQVCHIKPSIEVHHRRGRGRYLLDITTWLAVCRQCHDMIHRNPKHAYEMGYLEKRV